jgi:hypothetical protein
MMQLFFDRQGKPLTIEEAESLLGDLEYKRVGIDYVGDVRVSTVWLGIDHGFGREGPPIIFETMVFGGDHDQDCDRYCTEEQALAGHRRVVANLTAGRKPFDGAYGEEE